ncbi:MAG: hypothetical protein P1U88_03165 [Thalassobaculaceae bacterium]|nr:hypothetical protein [Thalassobaculaceae bacterium]
MGDVIAFPVCRRRSAVWTPDDLAALDRLAAEMPGATEWEMEPDGTRAFVLGAEDETLLIVRRAPGGLAISRGWERVHG